MVRSVLVASWVLGGALAAAAGPAAAATAPAPLAPAALGATRVEAPAPLRLTVPMAPGVRPVARALGRVPTPVVVRSGAEVRPVARPLYTGAARWDGQDEGDAWSLAAMRAVEAAPRDLRDVVPADIDAWCPGYERNPPHLRAAFWVGTVSALARHESTFDEGAVGGGGAWHGLLQIAPGTARAYGCEATSGEALRDGEANLACAIRIMSRTVSRDGVVAAGGGGIAADWGPMTKASLREQMREWVRGQDYCEVRTAVMASLRPVARPGSTVLALADAGHVAAKAPRAR